MNNINNKKRSRENLSPEESRSAFLRSNLMIRSPDRKKGSKTGVESTTIDMEKILEEMKKMTTVIKDEIRIGNETMLENWKSEFEKEINDVKEELKRTREQVKIQWESHQREKEEWEEERKGLKGRINTIEKRLEGMEKKTRRNNIVITGIDDLKTDNGDIKEHINNILRDKLDVEAKIRETYRVGRNKCVVEMENIGEKIKIVKNKNKLKGSQLYINDDLTVQERKIQMEIRKVAREEKEKGKNVKIGYMKLTIGDEQYAWNHESNQLQEVQRRFERTKN